MDQDSSFDAEGTSHGNELHAETAIVDSTQVRDVGGGEETGPSPVDRGEIKTASFSPNVDSYDSSQLGTSATVPSVAPSPLGSSNPPAAAPAAPKATSFHGSVEIRISAAKMRLVEVADEIISILASDPSAATSATVEINADFPNGVSDQIRRAVSENAGNLGFKVKTWE